MQHNLLAIGITQNKHGNPFPRPNHRSWEHCNGSTVLLRGFTCGVWTTFHTLTTNYYLAHKNSTGANESAIALVPLKAIQGWVFDFFGCTHCRDEFYNMTTHDDEYPMDSRNVHTFSS